MQAQRSHRTYNKVPNKLCTPSGMVTGLSLYPFCSLLNLR
jgi:hypothetical protein